MIYFSTEHFWLRVAEDGRSAVAGITQHAQETLGDIVFVELPRLEHFEQNRAVGLVESAKTASDLFMPVAARVVEVNTELAEQPELLNNDPLGAGWIFRVEDLQTAQLAGLMDETAYAEFAGG